MNFTHIYEDETFYSSERKSNASRSCEAAPASPVPAVVCGSNASASPVPAVVCGSNASASPVPAIVCGSLAPASSAPAIVCGSNASASPVPAIVCGSLAPASSAPAIVCGSSAPAPSARRSLFTPNILDFTALSGTTGFCDDAAADEIRRRIADFSARGLHFLDNGNFHYLTRFWCEKISEDFALVVYDHHVDLRKPVFPGLMSCGSWIRDVLLRNRHCRAVLIIGPERAQANIIERELQSLVAEGEFSARLCCFTEDEILDGRAARELPQLLDALHLPVYISIDKDVLSRKVLRTNWDQGIMTEAEFRHELDRFTMDPDIHILGADICGEPAYNACRRLLDDTRDLRRSDGVNRRLLEHYLARMQ